MISISRKATNTFTLKLASSLYDESHDAVVCTIDRPTSIEVKALLKIILMSSVVGSKRWGRTWHNGDPTPFSYESWLYYKSLEFVQSAILLHITSHWDMNMMKIFV